MGGRKQKFRKPVTGIFILGEGITEQHYFEHMKEIFGYACTIRPRFFCNTCIEDIENRIKEILQGDITIICIFDADVSKRNPIENAKLVKLRHRYRKNENVIFCDSLPSIEYWFLLHYRDTCPNYPNSAAVERELKKHIPAYEKTGDFLENQKWVYDMTMTNDNLNQAMERGEKYSHGEASYSNIYLAINKLNETIG